MGGGSAVKVPPLQIQGTQETPDALRKCRIDSPAQPLASDDSAKSLIGVEGCQNPRERSWRPAHVIVSKDSDLGPDLGDCSSHLTPFIGMHDREETNSGLESGHSFQHLLGLLAISLDGHEKELVRLVLENGPNRFDQIVSTTLQGRYDDRDILRSQSGIFGDRNGLEGVEGNKVHH